MSHPLRTGPQDREDELRRLFEEEPEPPYPVTGYDVARLLVYGGWLFAGLLILFRFSPFPETPPAMLVNRLLGAAVLILGGLFIEARFRGRDGRAQGLLTALAVIMITGWLLLTVV